VSLRLDVQVNAAGPIDAPLACPPFGFQRTVFSIWSELPQDADSWWQQSGGPAAVPSVALVSDRPTVFLTALNIPHHMHELVKLRMGLKNLLALQRSL
jgi:hypothetical protein